MVKTNIPRAHRPTRRESFRANASALAMAVAGLGLNMAAATAAAIGAWTITKAGLDTLDGLNLARMFATYIAVPPALLAAGITLQAGAGITQRFTQAATRGMRALTLHTAARIDTINAAPRIAGQAMALVGGSLTSFGLAWTLGANMADIAGNAAPVDYKFSGRIAGFFTGLAVGLTATALALGFAMEGAERLGVPPRQAKRKATRGHKPRI